MHYPAYLYRSVVAPPTAPVSSGLDVIVLDYPTPGAVQLNYPPVTHIDTPRSDITSSSAPTDYNDLPAPKYAANTADQTIGMEYRHSLNVQRLFIKLVF